MTSSLLGLSSSSSICIGNPIERNQSEPNRTGDLHLTSTTSVSMRAIVKVRKQNRCPFCANIRQVDVHKSKYGHVRRQQIHRTIVIDSSTTILFGFELGIMIILDYHGSKTQHTTLLQKPQVSILTGLATTTTMATGLARIRGYLRGESLHGIALHCVRLDSIQSSSIRWSARDNDNCCATKSGRRDHLDAGHSNLS